MRLDDDRQRHVRQFEALDACMQAAVAPADEAVHRLTQMQHPAAADLLGVELVAVADVIAAAVGAFMHGVESNLDAAEGSVPPGRASAQSWLPGM
jgi:hypothetical protein